VVPPLLLELLLEDLVVEDELERVEDLVVVVRDGLFDDLLVDLDVVVGRELVLIEEG
tara:strand:- start:822 stop:992 length:171 start_codon:yes stop_codon:yes gene_type:complete